MSKRTKKHKVKVRKFNRFPGLGNSTMWWADCRCGQFQGYHHKQNAQAWATEHESDA